METELIETPETDLIDFFEKKIEEFNVARWEIKEKKSIAVRVRDNDGIIVAGAAGKTFGMWLLLDNLWVSETLRRQDIGSRILHTIEDGARNRGCRFVLLETLDFQARPFYEKHGYSAQWIQNNYPRDGRKYFMTKDLK